MKNFSWLLIFALAYPFAAPAVDHQTEKDVRDKFIEPVMTRLHPQYKFQKSEATRTGFRYEYFDTKKPDNFPIAITIHYRFSDTENPDPKTLKKWHKKAREENGPETFEDSIGDGATLYDGSKTGPNTIGGWINAQIGSRTLFVHSFGITLDQLRVLARAIVPLVSSMPKPSNYYDELNLEWLEIDKKMIATLVPDLKKDPPDVSHFTKSSGDDAGFVENNLGFGYSLGNFHCYGGQVSAYGLGLHKGNQMVALEVWIMPNFPENLSPEDAALVEPVLQEVRSACDLKPSEYILNSGHYYWHVEHAQEPLPKGIFGVNYKSDLLEKHPDRKTIEILMTPFSGLEYGIRGGESGALLQNRREFLKIKHPDVDTCNYLMHSKNPVTRLTAIEYLIRNAKAWKVDLKKLEPDFQIIYKSYPKVTTLGGCIVTTEPAESLVKSLSKIPLKEMQDWAEKKYTVE